MIRHWKTIQKHLIRVNMGAEYEWSLKILNNSENKLHRSLQDLSKTVKDIPTYKDWKTWKIILKILRKSLRIFKFVHHDKDAVKIFKKSF